MLLNLRRMVAVALRIRRRSDHQRETTQRLEQTPQPHHVDDAVLAQTVPEDIRQRRKKAGVVPFHLQAKHEYTRFGLTTPLAFRPGERFQVIEANVACARGYATVIRVGYLELCVDFREENEHFTRLTGSYESLFALHPEFLKAASLCVTFLEKHWGITFEQQAELFPKIQGALTRLFIAEVGAQPDARLSRWTKIVFDGKPCEPLLSAAIDAGLDENVLVLPGVRLQLTLSSQGVDLDTS